MAVSPAAVRRGAVWLIAATATSVHPPTARDLELVKHNAWRELHQRVDQHRHARTLRTRFRRSPHNYLTAMEHQACQLTLPG